MRRTAWYNTNDNCPLAANVDQLESEVNLSYYNPFATNPAPHGGPKTDGMGDVCDAGHEGRRLDRGTGRR